MSIRVGAAVICLKTFIIRSEDLVTSFGSAGLEFTILSGLNNILVFASIAFFNTGCNDGLFCLFKKGFLVGGVILLFAVVLALGVI